MVTITDIRVRNSIFETVYDLINSAKSGYNTTGTPTLYGGHPDLDSVTFPAIVINPVDVNEDEYTVDASRSTTTKSIVVVVEVFSKKNADVDNMADGVTYTLRNNPFTGAFLTGVQDSTGFITPNDGKIKMKTITFTYMRR